MPLLVLISFVHASVWNMKALRIAFSIFINLNIFEMKCDTSYKTYVCVLLLRGGEVGEVGDCILLSAMAQRYKSFWDVIYAAAW